MKPAPDPAQPVPAKPSAAESAANSTQAQAAASPPGGLGVAAGPCGAPEPGSLAGPVLVAGALMFMFLTCPALVTELDADASLSAVLHFAAEHGLQFGHDIVSTYGPLGFLIFPIYSPHAASLHTASDLTVCFTVALGLCLVAWRLRPFWRCLLPCAFVWTAANVWLRTDLILHSGLFCWGLLSLVESGRRLVLVTMVFSVFGAFCAAAKVSLLFLTAPGLAVVGLHLALTGRGRLAAGSLACFTAVFLCGWTLAGQNPVNIPAFLSHAVTVGQSYNAALGVEGLQSVRPAGIATALLVVVVLLLRCLSALPSGQWRGLRRVLLLAWTSLFGFATWKHGFVRGDTAHVGFFLGFVPLLILSLEAIPGGTRRAKFWGRALGLVCFALPLLALQIFVFPALPRSAIAPLSLLRSNLQRIFAPGDYSRLAREAVATNERQCSLPQVRRVVGRAGTDVFGQQQIFAPQNDLNYRPRPVFQSYNACDARLMRLNEEYFLSAAAPRFWLFQLAPLDRKFAPLEDAWLLRDLLIDCELVASEKDFLLLRRVAADEPRMGLLKEGSVAPGEPIDLGPWGDAPLWLELTLEPSLAGRLRQFLFRPPTIRLAAWREPGKGLIYRHQAAVPMLEAGFLASPLLVRTEDVANLYAGKAPARPGAYSVDVGEGGRYWERSIRYRVYRIENQLPAKSVNQ